MSLPGNIGLLSRMPTPSSSQYGNVDGPASSTDNAVALFDGTSGKLLKNSTLTYSGTTLNLPTSGTLRFGSTTSLVEQAAGQLAINNISNSTPALILQEIGVNSGYFSTNAGAARLNGQASLALTVDDTGGRIDIGAANGNIAVTPNGTGIFTVVGATGNFTRLTRSSSGAGVNHLALYNPDTTNGNSAFLNFPTDTTGVGAATLVSLARIGAIFTTHDHATRAGELRLVVTAAGTELLAVSIIGASTTFANAIITTPQLLSGAGAVNLTTSSTHYTSTGGAQALTLANGTAGHRKSVIHTVDGGSGVLTPTTAIGFTTITFTNVGDAVELEYTAAGWAVIGSQGAVIA